VFWSAWAESFFGLLPLDKSYAKLKIQQKRSKNAQKVSKNEKYVKKWRENLTCMLFRSRHFSVA
jgi:hypothetical protein